MSQMTPSPTARLYKNMNNRNCQNLQGQAVTNRFVQHQFNPQ